MRKTIVAAGLSLVLCLPSVLGSQTPAEVFEARKKEAIANRLTEEGKQYEAGLIKEFFAQIGPWASECTKPPATMPANFEIALKLGAKGTVDDVLVDPEGPFATCFAQFTRKATYPAPPSEGYWMVAGLFLARPPEPEPAKPDAAEPEPPADPTHAKASARRLRATFIGNMAFHLTDGETAVLTDFPYESGAFGYMEWSKGLVPAGPAPLCLITHSHDDHFSPKLARDFCGRILGPKAVVERAGTSVSSLTLSPEVRWSGITFRPLATPHGNIEHYSYLVEWGGNRLYFTGDTDDTASLLEARDLDVAFVSPWLLNAVHSKGARIDARQVVVYHHRADEAYPEGQRRIVPKQGQVIEIGSR